MIREKKTKIDENDFLSMCVCADGVGCKQPVNIYVKNIPVKNGSGGTSPSTSPRTSPSSSPRTSKNSSGFRQVHPISWKTGNISHKSIINVNTLYGNVFIVRIHSLNHTVNNHTGARSICDGMYK